MVAPVLGAPLAVKFALNQIYEVPLIGFPLKFEVFEDVVVPQGWDIALPARIRHVATQTTSRLNLITIPFGNSDYAGKNKKSKAVEGYQQPRLRPAS
jgi:hypothetical protein